MTGNFLEDDLRCCGTGTCLINGDGICWCGQRWNGKEMCFVNSEHQAEFSEGLATMLPPTESRRPR